MTTIADTQINSFGISPEASAVPPEEPVFILTTRLLQEVIDRAVKPLQIEISKLRADQARDREEMAALIEAKREENIQEFNGVYKSLMLHRERLDKLSNPKKQPGTEKTASHLDELQLHLQAIKRTGAYAAVDFKEAARVLKLSKRRLIQLRPVIEADERFTIQKRGRKLYICLGYKTH